MESEHYRTVKLKSPEMKNKIFGFLISGNLFKGPIAPFR